MQNVTYSAHINASPEKVLHTMLDKEAYKIWTLPFNEQGSWYEGEIAEGNKIYFLGPDSAEPEKIGGMVSVVQTYIPNQFVSFSHKGGIENGIEDAESKEKWEGAFENYTVTEKDGGTDLLVELKMPEEFISYMSEAWPKALESLKKLVETI